MKEVYKLRLENDPHDYGSEDIEQILQLSVKRNINGTGSVINTSQIRTNLIGCYQYNQ